MFLQLLTFIVAAQLNLIIYTYNKNTDDHFIQPIRILVTFLWGWDGNAAPIILCILEHETSDIVRNLAGNLMVFFISLIHFRGNTKCNIIIPLLNQIEPSLIEIIWYAPDCLFSRHVSRKEDYLVTSFFCFWPSCNNV